MISFEIPVYYDVLSLLTTGSRDEGEIKLEVQGQLQQGDPAWDEVATDLENIAEEKGLDPETVRDKFCDASIESLMQYVNIDMDGIDVDYSESEALDDRRMIACRVPCTFDAERYL